LAKQKLIASQIVPFFLSLAYCVLYQFEYLTSAHKAYSSR